MYGEEEDEESLMVAEGTDRQVVVRAGFDNADEGDDEDESENDVDFEPHEEDKEGLADELEGLQDDLQPDEQGIGEAGRRTRAKSRKKNAGLSLDLFAGGGYSNPLLDQYSQIEPFTGPSALKVGKTRSKEGHEKSGTKKPKSALSPQRVNRSESAGSNKSVRFQESESTTPVTELAPEDEDDDEDDEDFNPAGLDGSTEFDDSDKENTEPVDGAIDPLDKSDSSSSSFSESDRSEHEIDEEDARSSSGTSSSDIESDSESAPDELSSNAQKSGIINEHSPSLPFPSRSQYDSAHAERGRKLKPAADHVTTSTSLEDSVAELEARPAAHPPVPPGNGKQKTRIRNLRRKASAALKFHKAKGDLPGNATKADLIKFVERTVSRLPPWMQELRSKRDAELTESVNDEQDDMGEEEQGTGSIAAKRQALLDSLHNGSGIEITAESDKTNAVAQAADAKPRDRPENLEGKHDEIPASHKVSPSIKQRKSRQLQIRNYDKPPAFQNIEETSDPTIVQVPDSLPKDTQASPSQLVKAHSADEQLPSVTLTAASSTPASAPGSSQKRRAKLDLAGSKRLLFGSLGLKPPKNKDEESALREKLMKDVRPEKPVKEGVAEIEVAENAGVQAENDDSDNWKDKIQLAAVECCHDGIQLSTPPFPFVQRWDPQQQGTYLKKKGRKSKKRKRMDQNYYQEDYKESPNPGSPSKVARQESYDANSEQPQFDAAAFEHDQAQQNQGLSHDQSIQDSAAANEQLLRETSESAAYAIAETEQVSEVEEPPDLPDLPEDLAECHQLKKEHCSAGAIIAFKKFLMSAETNWQPGISGYLTAAVRELHEDGTLLMTLARRDQPRDEARYDKETGERLYDKFEMPGYEEEVNTSDKSKLEMPLDELISPRLLRAASADHSAREEHQVLAASDFDDTLVGDEAQRAVIEPEAPVSLDSTMDIPSTSEARNTVPAESSREDNVGMIKDAGWRSSLGSGVSEGLMLNPRAASPKSENNKDKGSQSRLSPTFKSVDSSAHANDNDDTSAPLSADSQAKKIQHTIGTDVAYGGLNESRITSAKLAAQSDIEHPTLPETNEENELFQNQRQHRSVSLESNHQQASRDFVSPPPVRRVRGQPNLSPTSTTQSQKPVESPPKQVGALDGADDSSDEFPEPFSQAFEARMFQEPIIKDESLHDGDISKLSKAKGKSGSPDKTELSEVEEENAKNDNSFCPSQSEIAQSSQVVDLTISSDHLDFMRDEAEEMSSLKSSAGCVDKPKANMDIGMSRRSSKRKTRSRSTLAY